MAPHRTRQADADRLRRRPGRIQPVAHPEEGRIEGDARSGADRRRALQGGPVENAGQIITATQLDKFAKAARRRIRGSDGGYRRDHLRALAQRVEVSEREVRIMGSKNTLLRVLTSSNGAETAANGVRTFVPGWRRGWDSNPRYGLSPYNGLAN
ncbi:MAG: hypothetical protein MI785_00055, partial [Kiloniellales bacterium]|nr:hypothetical protein [Kiloniellales bacterium]